MSRPERNTSLRNRGPSDRPALLARRPSISIPGASAATKGSRDALPPPQSGKASGSKSQTKPYRTSKTSQKLVHLPSDPQTKPLLPAVDEEAHGYETDAGVRVSEHKSVGERMTKSERRRAGYRRITALRVCDGFKMKLMASFLKREHNVTPRAFDEALYVVRTFFVPRRSYQRLIAG